MTGSMYVSKNNVKKGFILLICLALMLSAVGVLGTSEANSPIEDSTDLPVNDVEFKDISGHWANAEITSYAC